jgi:hypothetical protein
MRLSIIPPALAALLLACFDSPASPPEADGTRQPVIVELFTSEGCSSCPPADALLQKLDQTQPVPGALVIALSEHVDYWDRLGWKDPFSSPVYARRQEAYGRRFRLDSVYTPQVVIDGTSEAIGSDALQIQRAILQSIKAEKLQVQISPVSKNSRGEATVHVQLDPFGKSAARGDARLMVALAENAVVSHVLRGENGGRKLDHVAVVRNLMDLGPLNSARAFSTDIPLTGELEHWNGKRIIAFVQDQQYGRIRGAAFRLLSSAAPN